MTRRSWRLAALAALGVSAAAPDPGVAAAPRLDHVIVVILENQNYERVAVAPYIASLIAISSSFSDYRAIRHPSQPNYLALWSGSTQGVTSNHCPPRGAPWTGENLGQAAEAANLTWRSYAEDLPEPGSKVCSANHNRYTRKHDPWTNFENLRHENERPYSDLAADIAAGTLPNLAFVIPNNRHNMHDRPLKAGDAWLAEHLPPMLKAVGPRGVVVLTWDENRHGPTNRILTVIHGAGVKRGYVSTARVTYYTLLRTLCDALSLPPLGAATQETPITDIWSEAAGSAAAGAPVH